MIRSWASIMLEYGERLLEDFVRPEELFAFARVQAGNAILECNQGSTRLSPSRSTAVHDVIQFGFDLGLDLPKLDRTIEFNKVSGIAQTKFDSWRSTLPDGKVIRRQRLIPGTGTMLRFLMDSSDQVDEDFLDSALNDLLRNIEVKRQDSLLPQPPLAWNKAWDERHDIAFVFCEFTRSEHDYRFINAALKLNDWGFQARHRHATGMNVVHLTRGILAQESVLGELWG